MHRKLLLLASSLLLAAAPGRRVSELTPLTANEVRARVTGQRENDQFYPAHAGPLQYVEDGKFFQGDGWGGMSGKYTISGNHIYFFIPDSVDQRTEPFQAFTLFKDNKGMLYKVVERVGDENLAYPYFLKPIHSE